MLQMNLMCFTVVASLPKFPRRQPTFTSQFFQMANRGYRPYTKNQNKNRTNQKREVTLVQMKDDFVAAEGNSFATLDGSSMEGGGQILRNAVALSAVLSKPVKIVNIRAKRDKPGLKPQHLTGILLVQEMFDATLRGGSVNSMEISFSPKGPSANRQFKADTKTAGSIGLLIQVSLPCGIFFDSPVQLTLLGGTNADQAPPIDYLDLVLSPVCKYFGVHFDINVKRRGFYPKGGGIVEVVYHPVQDTLQPINITDRGHVTRIYCRSFVSSLPRRVAERMMESAKGILEGYFAGDQNVKFEYEVIQETRDTGFGPGTGIIAVAYTDTGCIMAGSALGKQGIPAEKVGEDAANELLKALKQGGCCDEYLQDQVIIFMALAKGKSRLKTGPLTLHTNTSIHFTSCLTGAKFDVVKDNGTYIIECEGIGFTRNNSKDEVKTE